MIVLDTNVLSDLMRAAPTPRVLRWVERRPSASVFTTSITRAEVLCGIGMLPAGKRREVLWSAAEQMFADDLRGHVLPFDEDAAGEYARIAVGRRESGRPIAHADAQIAAICAARGATVATRNVDDFAGCAITVVNPWL